MTASQETWQLFVDLLDPAARADPYPLYRALRSAGPVCVGPGGLTLVSGYEQCGRLLRDPRMSSDFRNSVTFQQLVASGQLSQDEVEAEDRRPFLVLDPPDHTRLRRLVTKAFTPRVVERLRPRVAELITALLPPRDAGGTVFELVEGLAYPLPITVISELLGVPPGDRDQLRVWSRPLSQALDPPWAIPAQDIDRINAASIQLTAYLEALIEQRRGAPSDDLLSRLIAVEEAGEQLTTAEIADTCFLLFIAGHETTVNLISGGTLALLRHPAVAQQLRDDASFARAVVEETLRCDPPVQFRSRVALEPMELEGVAVEEGGIVMVLLAAANRDPAVYEDPEAFLPQRYADAGRAAPAHLSFGGGIHYCIGAALARLEGEMALTAIAERLRGARLADPTLGYRPGAALRGLSALPLELAA